METNAQSTNILTLSGLDFEVEKRPHYVRTFDRDGDHFEPSKLSSGIFRTDTGAEIGDVGNTYEPAQTAEILEPFLCAAKEGYLNYKSGRIIDGGARFSLTFDTGGDVQIHGDTIQKRVIVGSSHDGSWSTFIKTFVWRQVCSNGLMGFGKQDCFKIRHTENWKERYVEVLKALQKTEEFYRVALQSYAGLYEKPCPVAKQIELTNRLLDIQESEKDLSGRKRNQKDSILYLARNGRGIRGNSDIQGTAAAWYNAVCEFVDHHTNKTDNEKQFVSAFFGTGEHRKKAAFDLVAAM